MAQPVPDSLGIAQALVESFFPKLAQISDRSEAVTFYGEGATLYFQGNERTGRQAIHEYLAGLPPMSLNVTGYEVQTVPGSDLWSMVIVIGSVQIGGDKVMSFHSSVYVESRCSDQTAFIRYHSFNCF
jgi:hypothetical protein